MEKYITLNHLKMVTKSILKYVNGGKPVAANICPQCGAVVTSEDMTCEYCGTKLKLVVSKDSRSEEAKT